MTTQTCNDVLLEGTALTAPVLSHENHGQRFYRFPLEVPRLSGQADVLPVLLPEPRRNAALARMHRFFQVLLRTVFH